MLPVHHWANNFSITAQDVEYLKTVLLERETPLSTRELALILLQSRVEQENQALKDRFKGSRLYNPSLSYEVGQKLVFPALDFATGSITAIRDGNNPEYGVFKVAAVEVEKTAREFAVELTIPHPLSDIDDDGNAPTLQVDSFTAEDILNEFEDKIISVVEEGLKDSDDLLNVAQLWFPIDLMLEVNDGHLNLAEAVLDIMEGGPLTTQEILKEMGGLGTSPQSLQIFSLNFYMDEDKRFDEVGPAGEVLWFLTRMEPEDVRTVPRILRYSHIDYDRGILSQEDIDLEREIGDELSNLAPLENPSEGRVTMLYPHRRAGTLPLNYRVKNLFPRVGKSPRTWITLVDSEDGEPSTGWIVPEGKYVYGLAPFYRKYNLPIGGYVTLRKTEDPGKLEIFIDAYKARTEWVRLMGTNGEQIVFENTKRSIGADYDDQMILGIDDLVAVDKLVNNSNTQRKSLAAVIRMLIPVLGRLSPQGTVHATTLYSAVNIIRRCPPGPVLATLAANPDFENVGGHYWKLADA